MDPIDRQAAIDIVSGYAEQFNGYIGSPNDSEVYAYARDLLLSIERNINAIPSAQPEQREEAIIDPVDLVRNLADRIGIHQLYAIAWDMRGEPERKKGKWVYVDYGGFGNYHCSVCGKICICNGDYDFCPNCGAPMEVEE